MSNNSINWHEYFENNSQEWLTSAYEKSDYTYPVGFNRLRILKRILSNYDIEGKSFLDIGCGGGDISLYLASQGAVVDGIDMTEAMLETANERRSKLPEEVQERITFREANFTALPDEIRSKRYDFIVAFGLIGYLESDAKFFEIVSKLSHAQTVLILSCRNRLFNITSVTSNTVDEINTHNAERLIEEIDACYQDPIPPEKSKDFIARLNKAVEIISANVDNFLGDCAKEDPSGYLPGTGPKQPRNATPRDLCETASSFGYQIMQLYGVHPHLLLPRLNKKLPATVFNLLSDSLCAFEDEKISLIYSSVFIGEFRKTD